MIRRILNKLESIYYYRYFSKVNEGSSNTLLKKIYKSTDILLIEKVFQLDFFREIVDPLCFEINNQKEVLVLAPHQDDELIGLGGTLLKLKQKGVNITLVFLTDGASLANSEETVKIRSIEARKVANELNASIIEVAIPNDSMKIEQNHLNHLSSIFNLKKWDEIFTIWPIDNPPKHRICAFFVGKALEKVKYKNFTLTLYSVHTELIPNFFCEINDVVDEKQRLIAIYTSQLEQQAYDHLALSKDAWSTRFLPVSSEKRYAELFFRVNLNEYSRLINIFQHVNTNKLFKGHDQCIIIFNSFLKQL